MSKVEGRGPIDPPPPLCLRVTFFTSCLLGLSMYQSYKDIDILGTNEAEIHKIIKNIQRPSPQGRTGYLAGAGAKFGHFYTYVSF